MNVQFEYRNFWKEWGHGYFFAFRHPKNLTVALNWHQKEFFKQFIKSLIQFSSTDRTTYLACTPSTARMNSKLQRNQSSSNGERTLKDALRNLEVNATKEMLIHQQLSEKKFSCLYKVLRITSAHHLHYIQIQE